MDFVLALILPRFLLPALCKPDSFCSSEVSSARWQKTFAHQAVKVANCYPQTLLSDTSAFLLPILFIGLQVDCPFLLIEPSSMRTKGFPGIIHHYIPEGLAWHTVAAPSLFFE